MLVKEKNIKSVRVKEIAWGSIFKHENNFYIKTEYLFGELEEQESVCNAVNLQTGLGEKINDELTVKEYKKAKLVI